MSIAADEIRGCEITDIAEYLQGVLFDEDSVQRYFDDDHRNGGESPYFSLGQQTEVIDLKLST
jgi:hypothetical protein